MAGYYVRRGEKIVGPVTTEKLKELASKGQVVATDELAQKPEGPWTPCAKVKGLLPAAKPIPVAQVKPAAIVPTAVIDAPSPPTVIKHTPITRVMAVFDVVGRGALVMTSSVFSAVRVTSQRRHELKLAKLQSQAEIAKNQPQPIAGQAPAAHAAPQSIVFAPTMTQQTVVKNTIYNSRGCGCGGCLGTMLLIAVVVIVLVMIGLSEKPPLKPTPRPSPVLPIPDPVTLPEQP